MPAPTRRVLSLALTAVVLAASLQSAIAGTREDERARNAVRVLTDIPVSYTHLTLPTKA